MTLKTLCALVLAMAAGPALAEPPADAPTPTSDPATAEQIAAFLAASPAADLPADPRRVQAEAPKPDRHLHGVAEVAVGSHGYRSVYLETHMPLGDSGELAIAVGQSRGGFGGLRRYAPRPELSAAPEPVAPD